MKTLDDVRVGDVLDYTYKGNFVCHVPVVKVTKTQIHVHTGRTILKYKKVNGRRVRADKWDQDAIRVPNE